MAGKASQIDLENDDVVAALREGIKFGHAITPSNLDVAALDGAQTITALMQPVKAAKLSRKELKQIQALADLFKKLEKKKSITTNRFFRDSGSSIGVSIHGYNCERAIEISSEGVRLERLGESISPWFRLTTKNGRKSFRYCLIRELGKESLLIHRQRELGNAYGFAKRGQLELG